MWQEQDGSPQSPASRCPPPFPPAPSQPPHPHRDPPEPPYLHGRRQAALRRAGRGAAAAGGAAWRCPWPRRSTAPTPCRPPASPLNGGRRRRHPAPPRRAPQRTWRCRGGAGRSRGLRTRRPAAPRACAVPPLPPARQVFSLPQGKGRALLLGRRGLARMRGAQRAWPVCGKARGRGNGGRAVPRQRPAGRAGGHGFFL